MQERQKVGVQQAKRLRQQMTDVETKLWYHLRAKRFDGVKFRRQHPIEGYIVDFVCLKKRVVIELDGGQHCDNARDVQRDAVLQAQGFTVLRFWNHEVIENIDGVLHVIAQHVDAYAPPPYPSP
jgi:very-short-patch-repair endonuclease